MGLINLRLLSKLLNKNLLIYVVLIIAASVTFLYQKVKIKNLENNILKKDIIINDLKNEIKICKANNETIIENLNTKDIVIKKLKENIKTNKEICQNLIKEKDKLISDLQKLKTEKPKDIKPTVIVKKECKLKIETGEQLHEKDFIFDVLNSIGK